MKEKSAPSSPYMQVDDQWNCVLPSSIFTSVLSNAKAQLSNIFTKDSSNKAECAANVHELMSGLLTAMKADLKADTFPKHRIYQAFRAINDDEAQRRFDGYLITIPVMDKKDNVTNDISVYVGGSVLHPDIVVPCLILPNVCGAAFVLLTLYGKGSDPKESRIFIAHQEFAEDMLKKLQEIQREVAAMDGNDGSRIMVTFSGIKMDTKYLIPEIDTLTLFLWIRQVLNLRYDPTFVIEDPSGTTPEGYVQNASSTLQ